MTTFTHWRFHIDQQNIGWLELDVAGSSVNILQREVMREWAEIMDNLIETKGLAGLCLLSGKERGFVYGADIAEFDDLKTKADVYESIELADTILSGIEALDCPTVCGIDGVAVGGGLEVALAFDRIVVTSSAETKLGFPEIHLGIMPGYGGTGRAMRRIKAKNVLDMVLSGRLLSANEAKTIGLVDKVVKDVTSLRKTVADELDHPAAPDIIQTDSDVKQAVIEAKDNILSRFHKEQTPAPFLICEHFNESGADWRALVKSERTRFSKMLLSEASHHLRRVFLLNEMVRKSARGDSQIKTVHVIGAGTMGADIAAVAAMAGFQTSLSDIDTEAVHVAVTRAGKLFERRLKTEEKIKSALERLTADPDGKAIAKADIIIEAVAERLSVKQGVFSAVEVDAKPDAILATNTSSIMIEDIASALKAPERLIGLHFFNPVTVLPLVEVIAGSSSTQTSITRAMQFAGQLKKMPVKVKSVKGFLVNRALLPYLFEAIEVMVSGEAQDKLDQALIRFGMPMGPIELCDQIGLDVCFDVGQVLGMSDIASQALKTKVDAGQLGRKSGSGFYKWDDKKAMRPRSDYPPAELDKIAEDLLAPMIEKCRSAVSDGIVDSADHADIGCILGIGFPTYRGGPLGWADYPRV